MTATPEELPLIRKVLDDAYEDTGVRLSAFEDIIVPAMLTIMRLVREEARTETASALVWIKHQAEEAMAVTAGCATTHGDPGGGLEDANRYASDIAINADMALDALRTPEER